MTTQKDYSNYVKFWLLTQDVRMKIIYASLICLFLFFPKISVEGCYSEYWQQLFWKSFETDRFGVRTFVRIETGNHYRNVRSLFLSEQFVYKASKDLAFEIHYTYVHGHPLSSPIWRWQHRLEFEANKTFNLPCNYQIITRNRLEVRWRELAEPHPDLRFRQRTMLLIPLKNLGPLKAFSAFNELFYDISRRFFDQDRICPCQLTFEVTKKLDLDVFVIVRVVGENKFMKRSVILGTQLNF